MSSKPVLGACRRAASSKVSSRSTSRLIVTGGGTAGGVGRGNLYPGGKAA